MSFEIIKTIIDEWDPIELLAYAPNDEYDDESMEIFKSYTENIEDLGTMIFNVFENAFSDTFTNNIQECIAIASLIVTRNTNRTE